MDLILSLRATNFDCHGAASKDFPGGRLALFLGNGKINIRQRRIAALLDHFTDTHGRVCHGSRYVAGVEKYEAAMSAVLGSYRPAGRA